MAAHLGAEGYGINSQVNTLITFLVPISTLGLGFGIVRLVAGKQSVEAVSSRLYSTIIVVGLTSLCLSVVVFLSAPLMNQYFIKVDWATTIMRWSAPLIFLTSIEQLMKDYFRARLRIIAYSIFQVIQTIVYVAGIAIILTNGGGLLQLVWLWLGIKTVFNLATFVYFMVVGEIQITPVFMPRVELTGLLRFGFPMVIAGLGTWVTNVGDRWVIGYFMTINEVGVYNAAYTLAGVISAIASPFWTPLYPLMSAYYNDNNVPALYHASRKYTNGFALITIPAIVGLTILANPLLVRFGSPEFSIQPITFGLIILGLFIDQFTACIHYQIYLHNDPAFIRNAYLISGGANIALNLIAVPFLGITGAAAATFLSFFILDALLFRKAMSYGVKIKEVYDFKTIGKYCLGAAAMAVVVMSASREMGSDIIVLVKVILLGAAIYGLALLAIYKFSIQRLISSIQEA